MIRSVVRVSSPVVLALLLAASALAQQRPLSTHDPEVVGAGQLLLEAGFDYGRDRLFPASGLKGHLLRVPLFGVTLGLGSIVDVQVTGGLYDKLAVRSRQPAEFSDLVSESGDSTSDIQDLVFATRVRLVEEADDRPAVGVRLATRVPLASLDSGLGLGTMDFQGAALVGKTVQSLRIVGNLGLAILSSPERGGPTNTTLVYGASVARALNDTVDLVGELNGRAGFRRDDPPAGTEDRAALTVGARYTRGALRLDTGIMVGFTTRDPSIGITAGFTYALKPFAIQ